MNDLLLIIRVKRLLLGFGQDFLAFFFADFANEDILPADFATMRLQHDRSGCGKWLAAIPVVFHDGTVNDQLVVQPNPSDVADLANFHRVPFAEGTIGQY